MRVSDWSSDVCSSDLALGEPFSQCNNQHRSNDLGRDLQHGVGGPEVLNDEHVSDEHAARDPAQQTCTQRDYDREAVDQLKHQCAAPGNDGHAQQQAANDVKTMVIGDGARKSTRLNQYPMRTSYAAFCL